MSKLVYKPLEPLSKLEIKKRLERGKEDELVLLPLSVGEYAESWKEAQDVCLKLMEHNNAAIRANAALGLAYIARNHRMLDILRGCASRGLGGVRHLCFVGISRSRDRLRQRRRGIAILCQ